MERISIEEDIYQEKCSLPCQIYKVFTTDYATFLKDLYSAALHYIHTFFRYIL